MGKQFDTTNKDSMDELIEYSKELSKKQSKAADKYLKKEREKAAASSIPKLLDIANPNKFDIIQPYPRDVDELIKWTISSIETDFYIMNVYSLREKYRRYANIKDHWPIMLENVHPDWLKLKNAIISASNYIISELPCLEVEFFNRKKRRSKEEHPPPEWSKMFICESAFIDVNKAFQRYSKKHKLTGGSYMSLIKILHEKRVLKSEYENNDKALLTAITNHYGTKMKYGTMIKSADRKLFDKYLKRWSFLSVLLNNYSPKSIMIKTIEYENN